MYPHDVGALGMPIYSCEYPLFSTHGAHIGITLRREALRLRSDYARRQVLTLELSHVAVSAIERDSCAVERGNPVKPHTATAVLLTLLAMVSPVLADEQLLLIVSAASKIKQLGSPELRKVFLRLTVTHNGERLRPALNEADARVKAVFLRNVVSMSAITVYRRLLRLALQQGQTQPVAYEDTASLIKDIPTDPIAVSYAGAKAVEHNVDVKVIRILWQD